MENQKELVDFKIFGDKSVTYNITYKNRALPRGRKIHPDLFKLLKKEMPLLKRVYAGGCGARGKHYDPESLDKIYGAGHTHKCPKDVAYFNTICVTDVNHLFLLNGKPSDLIWHEYAHVLDKMPYKNPATVECAYANHPVEVEGDWTMHGDSFNNILVALGQGHIKGPYVVHQEYAQAAALIKK